jgi:mono/diheme cytochrome c family protein
VPLNAVRYGFDFTIPFNNAQQWLDIFKPAVAQAPEPAPTPTQAVASTPTPAASSPAPSAKPQTTTPSAAPTPAADAQVLAKAQANYTRSCAACHGAKGQGGFGPKLVGVAAKGDAFIAMRIKKGSPKGMPPFEATLTPAEVQGLVAYVKGL